MSIKIEAIIKRFVKAFISGAFTSMGLIAITTPANWGDLKVLVTILAFAAIGGGLNGVIMAGQKWYSWKE